jgi:N utilization substance protein A
MRGARVKNIVRELNNEKVDIIRWSEDPKEFVREALKPADLKTITVDEDAHVVHVTVSDEDLSKAIGRKGQNARLSSRLMGWDIQVRRDETKEEQFKEKIGGAAHTLCEQLGITEEQAGTLTLAGGFTPDLIVDMPADFIVELLGIPEAEASALLANPSPELRKPAGCPIKATALTRNLKSSISSMIPRNSRAVRASIR